MSAAQERRRICPADDAAAIEPLTRFREQLRAAVKARDVEQLRPLVVSDIEVTVLEGQVVLRSPEGRRLRGAAARRKPLDAEAADGLFLSPLESTDPSPDVARALAVVARRLGRDDRAAGWGVSDRRGAAVVHILHTEGLMPGERFTDVDGIPVVWSLLPAGAFERAGCSGTEVPEPECNH